MPHADPEQRKAYHREWSRKRSQDPTYRAVRASQAKTYWDKRSPEQVTTKKEYDRSFHQRTYTVRKYGITREEYHVLLEAQNHSCAICGSTEWGTPSPHVDHSHLSGKVRGLLCGNCNRGLGMFGDSPELMREAVAYLEKNYG